MLAIHGVSIRAGVKPLFENASLSIHPGQKVGLIGQNGVGKTTLFKAIMNEVPLDAGQISVPANWLIGYVEQEVSDSKLCALDYVCFGDSQYAELEAKIKHAEQLDDHDALVRAHDEMDRISGYEVPQKAQQLLAGLGFSVQDLNKSIQSFSGGWQVRLKLAKALMQRSDLLLLDEPTNHLDIEAVAWLIQWLKSYQGAVLMISHDRDFLDQVVQGIAHIQHQKIHYYSGNFAAFERQRNEQLMQQHALHEKQKQQMQHLKTFIERFKAKASKAKQAQSRVKALERMEQVAAVQATNPFHFEFFEPKHQPDPMVKVENVDFGYDDKPILQQASLVLRAGDRIGLVGVNGSGKTTLIKLLVGEVEPQAGKIQISKGVTVGYFAQHQLEALQLEHSPLQHMLTLGGEVSDQQARDFLGQFGFTNEQSLTPVATFSGGEKARLALAMIVYQRPNLVILDEPTNHLDMETRDALDMALQEFGGALIVVTHDKHLLASIADQFWWVHEGKVTLYHGDLESYLQTRLKTLKQSQETQKQAERLEMDRPVQNKKQLRQQNAQRRKQLDQLLKPHLSAMKKVEKQMEKAQSELDQLHELMEDSALYEAENKSKLTEILKTQASCEKVLEESELEWLELQEQIEARTQEFEGALQD
ncbi:MAG: ATP-binding cassette domain-containing protein [Thiomicrorhabdus chilensis]|uniref:ABC-F family ATP-binding cassette domain-containing protein n=1 Tax=Thiomicrorhabdus chilensis TaxID=63656 RepID=UPI00299D63D8|nr:ATP-binding cassette domain-containing protein [Thiomicrorhabdus chilensis]MDX1348140.1 ATP-binding cassette domain-containing protein [Thiomicrorhabdus chilensis]